MFGLDPQKMIGRKMAEKVGLPLDGPDGLANLLPQLAKAGDLLAAFVGTVRRIERHVEAIERAVGAEPCEVCRLDLRARELAEHRANVAP